MITEDYVYSEIAKLLKEKGFDGECDLFYRTDESELIIYEASKIAYSQGIDDECIILPTLQMTMKWLREKYRLNIEILIAGLVERSDIPVKWKYRIYDSANNIDYSNNIVFCTYEQTANSAIKYVLENLI